MRDILWANNKIKNRLKFTNTESSPHTTFDIKNPNNSLGSNITQQQFTTVEEA